MKLLIAFVQVNDVTPVADALRRDGIRFTRLPSFGGFLEEESATFIIAVDDDRVADALASFERSSQAREVDVPLSLRGRLEDWRAETVRHGGATVLVADLERIVQS